VGWYTLPYLKDCLKPMLTVIPCTSPTLTCSFNSKDSAKIHSGQPTPIALLYHCSADDGFAPVNDFYPFRGSESSVTIAAPGLLLNDAIAGDCTPFTVDIVTQPNSGTATVDADGTVAYTPDTNPAVVRDSLEYSITCPNGEVSVHNFIGFELYATALREADLPAATAVPLHVVGSGAVYTLQRPSPAVKTAMPVHSLQRDHHSVTP